MKNLLRFVFGFVLMLYCQSVWALEEPDVNGWMYSHTDQISDTESEEFYFHKDYFKGEGNDNVRFVWMCQRGGTTDKYYLMAFYLNEKMYTIIKEISMDEKGQIVGEEFNKEYAQNASEIFEGSALEAVYNVIKG